MSFVGLVLALILLGLSLLAIFRAPNLPLFRLAVGATEFGQWFALAALGVAAATPHRDPVGQLAVALSLVAAALLLSPSLRAALAARRLRKILRVFGAPPPLFRWRALFRRPESHRPSGERRQTPDGVPFDFYRAEADCAAPLVVVIHGGGWMAGAADEMAAWNRWLARRGFAVAAVEYTLVPHATWPRQRDEALAVIADLRAHAPLHGLDPDRVFLLGRSAGGQIAAAIATLPAQPWLRGCVALYAPFDMDFAYAHGRDDDALRSAWLLRSYLGGAPAEQPVHYREASAYHLVTPAAPPFLLLHGRRDELVWSAQSARFAARLADLGVPHAYLELPWATHAFDFHLHGPGGQILAAALETFFRHAPVEQTRAPGRHSSPSPAH